MNQQQIDVLKSLDYANLKDIQENRLRELEKKFNDEFGTDFYFMVMKK